MKHLKTYKQKKYGQYLGFSQPSTKLVAVNLTRVWEKTQDEKKFIKEFAKTLQHEYSHIAVSKCVGEDVVYSEMGEEKMIRKLCRERFPKKDFDSYDATPS